MRRKDGDLKAYSLVLIVAAVAGCLHSNGSGQQNGDTDDDKTNGDERLEVSRPKSEDKSAINPPSRTQRPAPLEDGQSPEDNNNKSSKSSDQRQLSTESLSEEVQDTTELIRNQQGDSAKDIALARRVKRNLWKNAKSFATPVADITVTAAGEVVTLSGTVKDTSAAKAIVDSVVKLGIARKVINHLQTK